MAFHLKIFNLFRQPTLQEHVNYEKYIPFFGDKDNFPLDWSRTIAESPSGASCLSVLQDFLQGDGFSDKDLEKLVVDSKGTTFFQFHQQTSDCYAEHAGVYWLVRYNLAGQITEFEVLPFENCRFGPADSNGWHSRVVYNPFFGTRDYKGVNDKYTIYYHTFNPDAVFKQIQTEKDKFKGQVLFFGNSSAVSRLYPLNEAYASKKWMKIEKGVSDYHEDNLNNGLLTPYIMAMFGDPNAPSNNPDYANTDSNEKPITVGQEFERVINENFMGAKRVGNFWSMWISNKDEVPEIIPLPANSNGDLFVVLDNQATKKITIAWKVPGVLANIQEGMSLGGDANQIRVAVKLMQQRVKKKQRIITDNYSTILKLMPKPYTETVVITPWNPYPELETLDVKIWEAMTLEERRNWILNETEIELFEEDEPVLDEPTAPKQVVSNKIPVAFPEKIRNNIKKTLDYIDKMQLKCTGKGGIEVANSIIENVSMGQKQMNRIHKYLKKNLHLKDSTNETCEAVAFNLWGGHDMYEFLESEINRLKTWLN